MSKKITMRGEKINESYLLYVIVFLILLALYLLVIGKMIKESIMVGIMSLAFFVEYKKANKYKNQEENIKEKGEVFSGRVLRVEEEIKIRGKNVQIIRRLLVKFFEGLSKKYIMTNNFPYPISIKKENTEDNIDINAIEFTQYYKNDCITFEEDGKNKKKFTYQGTTNSNFDGNLTRKVYKYKNKYLVDDFKGYETVKKTEYNILAIVMITIMLTVLGGVFYSVFFQR